MREFDGRPRSARDFAHPWRKWASKGAWAVTDQGLFALSNFGVSVLLARWLSPDDYGSFAVAFSLLLLIGVLQTALLTEPMLVFGPSRYESHVGAYLGRLSHLHFAITGIVSAVLLLGLLLLAAMGHPYDMAWTLAGLAIASPAILLLWLVRRACYIDGRPRLAAEGGLIYALLVGAVMFLLWKIDVLTAASALLGLGLASLVVSWWLRHRLHRTNVAAVSEVTSSDVIRTHWGYGRWALGSGVVGWIPGNLVLLALPWWHSLADAGALRVAMTLMMPVLHAEAALASLLMPAMVRARLAGRFRSVATSAGLTFLGLSLIYAPAILLTGRRAAEILFGPQYRIDTITLWLLAIIPLVTAISAVATAALRALEHPDRVLWSYLAAAAATCLVGLPLTYRYGVHGALSSMLLTGAITAAVATLASWRLTRKPVDVSHAEQPTGYALGQRKRPRHARKPVRALSRTREAGLSRGTARSTRPMAPTGRLREAETDVTDDPLRRTTGGTGSSAIKVTQRTSRKKQEPRYNG